MKYRGFMVGICFTITGALISWFYIPTDFRVWVTALCLAVSLLFFHLILWERRPEPPPFQLPYGWLVCISGPLAGTEYRLYRGKNFLGAGKEGKLKVLEAGESSEKDYGTILFDIQKREILLLPPEHGMSDVYLNDSGIVYQVKLLNSYDVIQFEDCRYIFVPLVCHHFQWAQDTR